MLVYRVIIRSFNPKHIMSKTLHAFTRREFTWSKPLALEVNPKGLFKLIEALGGCKQVLSVILVGDLIYFFH